MQYGTLISVVMPVYNRIDVLPRVVSSILGQSYPHFELIVVDDCSTEDVAAALAVFDDPRIRLVRRATNGGAAAARNTGVAAARGDWIAFHDSDDHCTHDRLELSLRAMAALPDDYIGVYGARVIYNEVDEADWNRSAIRIIPGPGARRLTGDLAEITMRGNIINFPTLMVRKAALEAAGPSDPKLRKNIDWDLCLRLTRQGRIGFVPEPLILTPTPLEAAKNAARVSRSARQGARSFMRITRKLRRQGVEATILAPHYATAGRYLMRVGRPRAARRFFAAALARHDPAPRISIRLAGNYLLSFMPGLHQRLRAEDKI